MLILNYQNVYILIKVDKTNQSQEELIECVLLLPVLACTHASDSFAHPDVNFSVVSYVY